MGPEENKALTRRIVDELLNAGSMESFDELVHADYVDGYGAFGRDEYRALVEASRTAFPDLHLEIEELVAERDLVAGRFTLRGTHEGEFLGVAPTGKRVEFAGSGFLKFRDGKLIGRWNVSDVHGLLEQLRAG